MQGVIRIEIVHNLLLNDEEETYQSQTVAIVYLPAESGRTLAVCDHDCDILACTYCEALMEVMS